MKKSKYFAKVQISGTTWMEHNLQGTNYEKLKCDCRAIVRNTCKVGSTFYWVVLNEKMQVVRSCKGKRLCAGKSCGDNELCAGKFEYYSCRHEFGKNIII